MKSMAFIEPSMIVRERERLQSASIDVREALTGKVDTISDTNSASSSQSVSSQATVTTAPSTQEKGDVSMAATIVNLATINERREDNNSIEQVDSEVSRLIEELGQLEQEARTNLRDIDNRDMIMVIKKVKQLLLRLNLSKNLVKYELKSTKEESRIERQLFLKSITNFERNLELLKNENQIINVRNLKLIRYCRKLKSEKLKTLKSENSRLRARLRQLENGTTDNIISKDGAISASRQSSNVSMLDTLGRLASHVLQDGDFIRTTSDRDTARETVTRPSKKDSS
ncbi:hypothetical protein FOA43_004667 [Brettanomyces nanus]|uniref:Uncharacterized protein n=1 Tax=Eeniella nana TaxID=13502 RepID=A0A875SCU3_EENNA|nr:uncharacterized protein FOA43_004667 [Brettanomyces nanus]QPG77259.1 hypothetical protein FOA43_004667 [Brettanomyces nanus]